MKFTLALTALIGSATAFTAPAAFRQGSKLNVSPYDPNQGPITSTGGTIASGPQGGALATGIKTSGVPDEIVWDSLDSIRVQGGALKTWSFQNTERLVVAMNSDDESLTSWTNEGRLMYALISLCQGPDNTPVQLKIKSSKGVYRPFKGIIETPGSHCSLFIRNIGEVEFPITAGVAAQMEEDTTDLVPASVHDMSDPYVLLGGSVITYPLESAVKKVKVLLSTDGRPLNAKVELIMGPNAVRYEMDIYSEDGIKWPFYTIIETPGQGNSIRVVNTATQEFPLTVDVQPIE